MAWDRDKVVSLYGEDMGNKICEIPIIREGWADRVNWYHAPDEVYSTKSGYSWLTLKKVGFGPHRNFWRLIWKLKLPRKVRIFSWRVGHNLSPTNSKIVAINHAYNSTCSRCGVAEESLTHALRDCIKAKDVLLHGGIDGRILNSE